MNRKEEALKLFESGFNCSQAVLSVFFDELPIDKETALKLATGFGGGLCNGELCGAVTGAIMILGLKYGHSILGDDETQLKMYDITKEFTDKFKNKHGEIVCKKLLGYDLSIPGEYDLLERNNAFKTECPNFIESAIKLVEKIIENKE